MKAGWKQKLILAWGLGIVAGTFYANFFLEADKSALVQKENMAAQILSAGDQWKELFLYLSGQRLALFFSLLLVSLTVFGLLALYGTMFAAGFSIALLLSVITMNTGLKGLFYYGLLWTPQILFYGPAFWGTVCLCTSMYREMWAEGTGEKKGWQKIVLSHLTAVFVLFFLWILGIAAETWGNPWVLSLFLNKI